jgi:hypothetical protein
MCVTRKSRVDGKEWNREKKLWLSALYRTRKSRDPMEVVGKLGCAVKRSTSQSQMLNIS